ncbi:cytochrome P450 [Bisporella sp. PMI_857]|nr:cytochrome P450 [Bisporella sp. PMI_857]
MSMHNTCTIAEPLSFSFFEFNPPAYLAVLGILSSLSLFYSSVLPKPIPGIPYNKEAAKSLFGDVGPMVKQMKETDQLYNWMAAQNLKLQSPIIQLFARPFARPWVIITDFREARDISGGVTPKNHFCMRTDDEFKRHRRWVQGLMTPGFLNGVAAPHIYHVCLDFLQLWEQKSRLAQGYPFAAAQDVHRVALDAIWTIVFGTDPSNSTTEAQLELYLPIEKVNLPSHENAEAVLPYAPYPAAIQSVLTLTQSVETSLKSPVPKLAHLALRQTSTMKNAYRVKEKFIKEEIEKALDRFKKKSEKENDVRCAVDDILRREILLAEKEKRATALHSRGIYDEILGLLIAAHDTTGTAITWALKLLADNPTVQDKLRSELQSAHAKTVAERRPTAPEITSTAVHYRAIIRTAIVDVEVLGHRIPKGTEVFFMGNGPSIFSPAFPIDDSLRSQTYFATKEKVGCWNPEDMAAFNPDRWLVKEDGKDVFDAAAGPLLTFGLGERGCYGRKLSYVEMKLFITLIVWTFELHKCPKELSGHEAVDKMTHGPKQCYVKLVKLI